MRGICLYSCRFFALCTAVFRKFSPPSHSFTYRHSGKDENAPATKDYITVAGGILQNFFKKDIKMQKYCKKRC